VSDGWSQHGTSCLNSLYVLSVVISCCRVSCINHEFHTSSLACYSVYDDYRMLSVLLPARTPTLKRLWWRFWGLRPIGQLVWWIIWNFALWFLAKKHCRSNLARAISISLPNFLKFIGLCRFPDYRNEMIEKWHSVEKSVWKFWIGIGKLNTT